MSTGFPPGRSENTSGQRLAPEWSPRCELVSLGYGCWHTGSRCFFQVSVHKGDGHRPLARCGGDALDRAIAHVPYHTTLEEVVNLPGTGVVAMPEEANNDSHLGAAVPDLVSHAIPPRPVGTRRVQAAHRRPSVTP